MKWGIQFVFVDEAEGEFVDLAGYCWVSEEATREAWDKIEEVPDSNYLADLWIDDCTVETKYVTVEFIEEVSRRPIKELIDQGRVDLSHWKERLADALKGRTGHRAA